MIKATWLFQPGPFYEEGWAAPQQPCQADVLIKLFNEKKTNDIKQEFGIETGEYEEYETSIDITDNE